MLLEDLFSSGSASVDFSFGQLAVMGSTLINQNSLLEISGPGFMCGSVFNAGNLRFNNAGANLILDTFLVNSPDGEMEVDTTAPLTFSCNVENNGQIMVGAGSGFRGLPVAILVLEIFSVRAQLKYRGRFARGNSVTGVLDFPGDAEVE